MTKPHDNAYKFLFSNKRIFLQLLKSFVHEDFVKGLTENNLELADKTFVSEEMLDRESDLLYKINLNKNETYIYILMEFQSTPDKAIPIRMFQYILLLYDQLLKNSKKGLLPNVFPLLLYNGSKKWTVPRNIGDLIEKNIPANYIPSFEYFAIIQNEISDTFIDKLSNLIAAVIKIENAGNEKKLRVAIDRIVMYIKDEDPSDIRDYFLWLKNMFKVELKEIELNSIRNLMGVKPMLAELVEK
ncbi:MAG TPA: Rpn family recombination-promoting nuclease/putative transposase, partial [Spirochaetota bacterium]|nr:Rpn family recombination-promoting nuclease/putative transposase [Spirochaetota bacterium]